VDITAAEKIISDVEREEQVIHKNVDGKYKSVEDVNKRI